METFEDWMIKNPSITTEQRELVARLISEYNAGREHQKIRLNFSQSDLEDLMNGEEHIWAFPTDRGEIIDLEIFNEDFEGVEFEEGDESSM